MPKVKKSGVVPVEGLRRSPRIRTSPAFFGVAEKSNIKATVKDTSINPVPGPIMNSSVSESKEVCNESLPNPITTDSIPIPVSVSKRIIVWSDVIVRPSEPMDCNITPNMSPTPMIKSSGASDEDIAMSEISVGNTDNVEVNPTTTSPRKSTSDETGKSQLEEIQNMLLAEAMASRLIQMFNAEYYTMPTTGEGLRRSPRLSKTPEDAEPSSIQTKAEEKSSKIFRIHMQNMKNDRKTGLRRFAKDMETSTHRFSRKVDLLQQEKLELEEKLENEEQGIFLRLASELDKLGSGTEHLRIEERVEAGRDAEFDPKSLLERVKHINEEKEKLVQRFYEKEESLTNQFAHSLTHSRVQICKHEKMYRDVIEAILLDLFRKIEEVKKTQFSRRPPSPEEGANFQVAPEPLEVQADNTSSIKDTQEQQPEPTEEQSRRVTRRKVRTPRKSPKKGEHKEMQAQEEQENPLLLYRQMQQEWIEMSRHFDEQEDQLTKEFSAKLIEIRRKKNLTSELEGPVDHLLTKLANLEEGLNLAQKSKRKRSGPPEKESSRSKRTRTR